MARPLEYKKAKTCRHAIQLTEHGGLFIHESCVADNKLQLPCPTITGIKVRRPYIMAKYCNTCSGYIAKEKKKPKDVKKGTHKATATKSQRGRKKKADK